MTRWQGLLIWIAGSAVLRSFLTATAGDSTSIYGPLAAPIAIMIWLYILAIAVLIGAALNASFDELWPESAPARARIELVRRLRRAAMLPRLRRTSEEDEQYDEVADEVAAHLEQEPEQQDQPEQAPDDPGDLQETAVIPRRVEPR